jgi:hypothetical protein
MKQSTTMKKSNPTNSAIIDDSQTPSEIVHKKIKPKKTTDIKPIDTTKTEEISVTPKINDTKIRPVIISFYGNSIRNTFMNNQWYFSLEDILRVAKVIDPTKFLVDLKNHDTLKNEYYNLVETFSYYEGDNPIIIPIVNYQNFTRILPTIRAMEYFMPGPFPEWLKNMAHRNF